MLRLLKSFREKGREMSLLQNAKSRIVVVMAPLFLGFVVPLVLEANLEARNLAQLKFDPSAMFIGAAIEVVLVVVFAAVFALSLLYFAKQDNARKLLAAASAISLVSFAAFAIGQSITAQLSPDGWLYYALMQMLLQMFPGIILVVGYAAAAIAAPLIKPSGRN